MNRLVIRFECNENDKGVICLLAVDSTGLKIVGFLAFFFVVSSE